MPERPTSPSTDDLPSSGAEPGATPSEVLLADERDPFGVLGADAEVLAVGAITADVPGTRRRFGQGLSVAAWVAIGWMVFIVAIAVLAKIGLLTWGDPQNSIAACARKGPFANDGSASGHLLGCDSNGRDMIARLALGGWTSLLVSTGAIGVGFLVGGGLGIIAGYFGGIVDTILTGTFNVMLSVPAIIFALALVAFLQAQATGQSSTSTALPDVVILIIAIGIVSIPLVGRIARASALSWAQREFVLAARAQGAKNGRVMIRELLPNVAPALFSIALLGIAIAIVAEGTLAILGVGVKPPTPSWGNIIAIDRGELFTSPHITFEPSVLIFVTVLALNFLGDVVRSRFDVREAGI